MNKLKQRFGPLMATSMVIGIVIGSGIFIKSGSVLRYSGGNLLISILAWLIGGLILISNAYAFSLITVKLNESNGLPGYVTKLNGEKLGYYVGFFMSAIYLPVIGSVISYFSAFYLLQVFNIALNDLLAILVPIGLLLFTFILNILAPKLSGKFQVSTTFIKLIPIFLMIILAVVNYITGNNNDDQAVILIGYDTNFFGALLVTCFAYEGWIVATSIHSEIKNPKKNLPKALLLGSILVVLIYVIYNIAISFLLTPHGVISADSLASVKAFSKIFGSHANFVLTIFLFISCMGTLNGLTLGSTRAFYTLSQNKYMFGKNKLNKVNEKLNIPVLSSMIGLLLCVLFIILSYLAFYKGLINPNFDAIVCAVLYLAYIPLYISLIKKYKDLNFFNRFIAPILAIIGSLFFVFLAMFELVRGFVNSNTILMKTPIILILILIALIVASILKKLNNKKI